jgi:hypothetical protein
MIDVLAEFNPLTLYLRVGAAGLKGSAAQLA